MVLAALFERQESADGKERLLSGADGLAADLAHLLLVVEERLVVHHEQQDVVPPLPGAGQPEEKVESSHDDSQAGEEAGDEEGDDVDEHELVEGHVVAGGAHVGAPVLHDVVQPEGGLVHGHVVLLPEESRRR